MCWVGTLRLPIKLFVGGGVGLLRSSIRLFFVVSGASSLSLKALEPLFRLILLLVPEGGLKDLFPSLSFFLVSLTTIWSNSHSSSMQLPVSW